MLRAMAHFKPGLIVRAKDGVTYEGAGVDWLHAIEHSLFQWHWDLLASDGSALVFMIINERVPHFRQKWEDDAPAGATLLPSLLDAKATVPAVIHQHPELKKAGVLPAHSTFDVMKLLHTQDGARYYLARPDFF
jgi:hypothetical protein